MTVSFVGMGNKVGGATPLIIGLPAPLAKGDLCLVGRTTYFTNTDVPLPEPGWDREALLFGGTGVSAGNHQSTISVESRVIDGTEQSGGSIFGVALLALDHQTGANGGAIAQAATYRKTGRAWDVTAAVGDDNSHGANRSVTASTPLALAPGDVVTVWVAFDTEPLHTITAETLTAAGITFGAVSRRSYTAGTTTGHDGNLGIWEATVTAGTATVAPTFSFTTATSQCGPVAFVRLREAPPIVSGWRPTTANLLGLRDVPRRFDRFRFELVDPRNRRLGDVHPDLDKNPTITWDTTRRVHRSLDNFYLPAHEHDHVNKIIHRVRAYMVLQNGEEFSLGVFVWSDANEPRRPWGYESEGQLVDKTYILDQPTITPFSIPRHTRPLTWIFDHIRGTIPEFSDQHHIQPDYAQNFPSAVVEFMIASMGEEAASKELGSPVNWQGGTTHLVIGNDVMKLVGYLPLHCDRNGTLIFRSAPPIATVPLKVRYPLRRIIENSIVRSADLVSAPNYVVVTDSAANQTPIRGVWRAPAAAPHSEANRRYAVGRYITVSGLSDQTEADDSARRHGEYLMHAGEWIEWQSAADPRHDAYDVMEVEEVEDQRQRVLEVSWKMVCVPGQPMQHRGLIAYPEDVANIP